MVYHKSELYQVRSILGVYNTVTVYHYSGSGVSVWSNARVIYYYVWCTTRALYYS